MKLLSYTRKWFRRALIVSLLGASSITFQLLRAQPADASPASPPAVTNFSTAQGTTNAAPSGPALQGQTNTPSVQSTSTGQPSAASEGPPQGETNAPSVQSTSTGQPSPSSEGPPQGETNTPSVQSTSTNQPSPSSEGPPQGETNAPSVQSTSTGQPSPSSEVPPQGIPNSPAVQVITNQPNNVSESLPQEIPNSPSVQDITNQTGFWDNLWREASPLHFGLNVGEMYDDNILISPNKTSSFITHISPSIDFQKGDQTAPDMNYLNLYFAPAFYLYQDHSNYNRADYNGDIYYQYAWTRLTLGFEQQYQHLTDANLDEGTLVSRNIYTTKLTANYVYDDDLTFFDAATQQINNYPGLTINEWDIDSYALYQLAPKLRVGAGPRFCFLDITGAPNETHQDLLARLKYNPAPKLSMGLDGGVEYLEYQNNAPSRLLPIFDGNIAYVPFEGTDFFVAGYRATLNSYDFRGDTIAFTSVQAGASQQFLQDMKSTLSVGYNMSDYQSTSGQTQSGQTQGGPLRQDNYYFAKGIVEWDPNRWLKVEASYQWSESHSTFAQYSFGDNQIDIQSSIKF